jgi:AraC-like DNA-binding protein
LNMDATTSRVWSLPVSAQPEVVRLGYGPLGTVREERFLSAPQWQVCLFEGKTALRLERDGQSWQWFVEPRTVLFIPSGSTRYYTTPRRIWHYYVYFTYPQGIHRGMRRVPLSPLIRLGSEAESVERTFSAAIDLRDCDRLECDLHVWLLILRMARLSRDMFAGRRSSAQVVHSVVERARRLLDDENLTPVGLARDASLSRRRLDQLFTNVLGVPVGGWIKAQRLARARHLLETTTIPIGRIGVATGLGDPHQFNKFIRRTCGASPTEVRRAANRSS